MGARDLLRSEIYPRLTPERIFDDLDGVRVTNAGLTATCPSCGRKSKFFAKPYDPSSPYAPSGSCFRASCGYRITWWEHTAERYGLTEKRDILEKLAELAGVLLPARPGRASGVERRRVSAGEQEGGAVSLSKSAQKSIHALYHDFHAMCREARKNLLSVVLEGEDVNVPKQAFAFDNYLSSKRKWPIEWIKKCPSAVPYPGDARDVWQALVNKGYAPSMLKASGLFRYGWGEHYNVLIPYPDEKGNIVAFVARLHPDGTFPKGDPLPKYMGSKNLSDQSSYKDIPFGLYGAKTEAQAKGELLLVEGFFDQMAFSMSGVKRCVAVGTNRLTGVQAEFLLEEMPSVRRYIFALDYDEAGKRGVIQSVANVLDKRGGEHVSFFVQLPPSKSDGSGRFKDFDEARISEGVALDEGVLSPISLHQWVVENPLYPNDSEYNRDRNLDWYAMVLDIFPRNLADPVRDYLFAKGFDVEKIDARRKTSTVKGMRNEMDEGRSVGAPLRAEVAEVITSAAGQEPVGGARKRKIPGYRPMMDDEEARERLREFVQLGLEACRRQNVNALRAMAQQIRRRKDLDNRGYGRRLNVLAGKVLKCCKRWHFRLLAEELMAEARRLIAEDSRRRGES